MGLNRIVLLSIFALVSLSLGCRKGPVPETNQNNSGGFAVQSTDSIKRLQGVKVLVEEASWAKFIEDKIVVDIEEEGIGALNSVRFSSIADARNECFRRAKASRVTAIVVFLHEKGVSAEWVEEVCEDCGLDCLVHPALGGANMGRHESLMWVLQGCK